LAARLIGSRGRSRGRANVLHIASHTSSGRRLLCLIGCVAVSSHPPAGHTGRLRRKKLGTVQNREAHATRSTRASAAGAVRAAGRLIPNIKRGGNAGNGASSTTLVQAAIIVVSEAHQKGELSVVRVAQLPVASKIHLSRIKISVPWQRKPAVIVIVLVPAKTYALRRRICATGRVHVQGDPPCLNTIISSHAHCNDALCRGASGGRHCP
jgi:hypothetical protein